MDGAIRVSLEREPSVALAAAVEGERHATVVARDPATGRVVGMGSRSVLPAYVGGAPCRLGYLSQLRLDRAHRGRLRAVASGYELLRATRRPDEAPFDVTTIVADNRPARRLLEARLPELPAYREVAPFVTLVLQTWRRRRRRFGRIERGSPERLPEIVACLDRHRRRHEVAPLWTVADLLSPERCRGSRAADFFGSRWGTAGWWGAWRSGIRAGSSRSSCAATRRGSAAAAVAQPAPRACGGPRLPDLGEALPTPTCRTWRSTRTTRWCSGRSSSPRTTRRTRASRLRRDRVCRGSPVADVLKRYRPRRYESVLYAVEWDEAAGPR